MNWIRGDTEPLAVGRDVGPAPQTLRLVPPAPDSVVILASRDDAGSEPEENGPRAPASAPGHGWMERESYDSRLSRFLQTQLPPINLRCEILERGPLSGGRAARLLESGSANPGQDCSNAAGPVGTRLLIRKRPSSAELWAPCQCFRPTLAGAPAAHPALCWARGHVPASL